MARLDFRRDGAGYYMSSARADAPLGRTVDFYDSVIPSGNAIMFRNLVKIAAITGELEYLTEAKDGLDGWSGLLDRGGLELAGWLDAVACVIGPYYDVVIAGDFNDEETRNLRNTYWARLPASAVVSLVPADGASQDLLALAPALADKKEIGGQATAYVCEFGTCQAPTAESAVMMEQVMRGWTR